jgi:hypothetical protein
MTRRVGLSPPPACGKRWAEAHPAYPAGPASAADLAQPAAGQPLARDLLDDLRALREQFDAKDTAFEMLASLLAADEMRLLRRRLDRLVATGKHPDPGPGRNVPWPPV